MMCPWQILLIKQYQLKLAQLMNEVQIEKIKMDQIIVFGHLTNQYYDAVKLLMKIINRHHHRPAMKLVDVSVQVNQVNSLWKFYILSTEINNNHRKR